MDPPVLNELMGFLAGVFRMGTKDCDGESTFKSLTNLKQGTSVSPSPMYTMLSKGSGRSFISTNRFNFAVVAPCHGQYPC